MGDSPLAFQKIVKGLTPATLYDVFVMTEASGSGEVRAEVIRHSNAARTHALAPEVSSLVSSPLNASASALDVSFRLDVDSRDVQRVTSETVAYFKYDLHYEVTALSENPSAKPREKVDGTTVAGVPSAKAEDKAAASKNTTIHGVFSLGGFSSAEEFHASLNETQHANITGLESGTLYSVKLRAETAVSNGLFGRRELTTQAQTHEQAPAIVAASVKATNRSVNALTLTVELARPAGNIHYLLTGKSGATPSLRSFFQQASSMPHLQELLRERAPKETEDAYVAGVFKFAPSLNASASAKDAKTSAGDSAAPFKQQFQITGLEDATTYSIVLFPETTGSFGLFGPPFGNLLDAATNENASEVELRSAKPQQGNVSSIRLEVDMTKPQDVLFLCLSPDNTDNGATKTAKATKESSEHCREVEDRASFELDRHSPNRFTFKVGNLSEDTSYRVSLYAENARRNGVLSTRSAERSVRTHKRAPRVVQATAKPLAATTSHIEARVMVESDSPCLLHYVVRKASESLETGEDHKPIDAATIMKLSTEGVDPHSHQHRGSSSPFVSSGHVFSASKLPNATTSFVTKGLSANTTYEVLVVTETSRDGNSSGVLGEPIAFNATTHAVAPTIVLATVDPIAGSIDSVVISVNLSHPGELHYFLSDVDFADPAVIRRNERNHTPHELRGQLQVLKSHIAMEIINGTNDTQPMDPPVFAHNMTLSGLRSGATYHVSLTTETRGSDGVFGEFPPPILVNTNLGAPVILPETLSVRAVAGSSSALAIDFQLDRFGDVHYALFFRGLIPDRSQAESKREGQQPSQPDSSPRAKSSDTEAKDKESESVWPPPASTFDLSKLNGSMLKAADFGELGVGVWVNDTLSVSREDVTRGKTTHKEIDKLPPNALFDVCLVSETAASGGIFGWPSTGSTSACHRVATHAEYTNQSVLLDEVAVSAVSARTDGIHISLNVSKLLKVPKTTEGGSGDVLDRFARAAGRVPYFILFDAKAKHGNDLGGTAFASHRGEITRAFKEATPGHGDGVIAAGVLTNITAETATNLQIEQSVLGLRSNHEYLLFFAYETSGSDGVFTRVNPHKQRSNESRSENDGILVVTHEAAPRISKAQARPTFGSTSRVTAKFDIACEACERALVHLLVFPEHCTAPSSVSKTLHLAQAASSDGNSTTKALNTTSGDECKSPLIYKSVEIEMPEQQHSRNDVEEELGDEFTLAENTSYAIFLATETVGSYGVMSESFSEPLRVRTHAPAPSFTELRLTPRAGSTTELLLVFALDRPGEVHYMLGPSGNPDFNATSPHNVSSKGMSSKDRHGNGRNSHDYPRDVVRMRRSVSLSGGEHIELLEELTPGMSYDLLIVAEAAPGDHGIYGTIQELKEVSTFANAPILLAHAAYPTPGTTQALTVGFRMDAPGVVHFSVVVVTPWEPTQHVAEGSDRYGNRLALKDRLVTQESLEVEPANMEVPHDSGWREQTLEVPQTGGTNYTVHLVTETKDSGGIYGIVATHKDVRTHPEAPDLLDVSVSPADARVDALTVNVTLSDRGHVHYIALPSSRRFSLSSTGDLPPSLETAILANGSVDINETDSHETSFTLAGLTEGTTYDLYFRSETLESFGVFGAWTHGNAVTARTHGLPPDVLLDALECRVTPSCEQRGRETVSPQLYAILPLCHDIAGLIVHLTSVLTAYVVLTQA
ncbi:hypothetical protein BBJ28_00018287 [Nothophytophthora sp. Chile5]|nr:hypothetical protein BBJ28_00018287 [Nothophytophthora sp. Chile5]